MVKHSALDIQNARLASGAAYKNVNKIKQEDIPQGYSLDTSRSGRRTKVFKNDDTKHIIVAHRGTNNLRDVGTDISGVVLGKRNKSKRFQQAKRATQQVVDENPEYTVTNTGHSLGGTLAQQGGHNQVTFNKGAGFKELFGKRKKNQTDIRRKGDLVSLLSKRQKGGHTETWKGNKFNFLKAHRL